MSTPTLYKRVADLKSTYQPGSHDSPSRDAFEELLDIVSDIAQVIEQSDSDDIPTSPPSSNPRHPMQPVVLVNKVARFRSNKIVAYLLDRCTERRIADMNMLAILPFSQEDREQFAQLIGYSVSGAGDLSYMSEDLIARADAEVEKLREKRDTKKKEKK